MKRVDSLQSDTDMGSKQPRATSNSQTLENSNDFMVSCRPFFVNSRFVNLLTPIQPHQADHSFNGIIAILHCKGPERIRIHGFGVGGALGPVTVLVHKDPNTPVSVSPDPSVWRKVFEGNVAGPRKPSELAVITLPEKIVLDPGVSMGFYVHVAVLHDDGLSYQTYRPGEVIVDDGRIQVLCGAGRCGDRPFIGGWWRGGRGLTGSVLYEAIRKVWTTRNHSEFPVSFRNTVVALLILWSREGTILNCLPAECMFAIFEQLEYDWFETGQPTEIESADDAEAAYSDGDEDITYPNYYGQRDRYYPLQ